ncbi:hypothetical protein ONZ45_g3735 [Pleurotus djamor]|nr:hypothetical protein ONZ45_g3735 [Pleurotus djamor]
MARKLKSPAASRSTSEQTCCGVIQETKYQVREKRAQNTKPQPWIALKLMVFITVGIMGYGAYVYIGRFCVPMLIMDQNALGSRALGIVFLIIFAPFHLVMIWAYERVVVTPPGYAKDVGALIQYKLA